MEEIFFLIAHAIQRLVDESQKGYRNLSRKEVEEPEYVRNLVVHDSEMRGWEQSEGCVSSLLKVSLWPGHPDYEPPTAQEFGRTCYRNGELVFKGFQRVEGNLSFGEPDSRLGDGPDGWRLQANVTLVDYGPIGLETTNSCTRISGIFGEVSIYGGTMKLEIEQPPEARAREAKRVFRRRIRNIVLWGLAASIIGFILWLALRD